MKNLKLLILLFLYAQAFALRKPILLVPFQDNSSLPGIDTGMLMQNALEENNFKSKTAKLLGQQNITDVSSQTRTHISSSLLLKKINDADLSFCAYISKQYASGYALCGVIKSFSISENLRSEAQIGIYLVNLRKARVEDFMEINDAESMNETGFNPAEIYEITPESADFKRTSFGILFARITEDITKWINNRAENLAYEIFVLESASGEIKLSAGREAGLKQDKVYPVYRLYSENGIEKEIKAGNIQIMSADYFSAGACILSGAEIRPNDYIKIE